VLAAAFFQRLIQFAQQLLLVLTELDRCLDRDMAIEVAWISGAYTLDTLAAQAELLAGLRSFGNVDGGFASQRGHINLTPQ